MAANVWRDASTAWLKQKAADIAALGSKIDPSWGADVHQQLDEILDELERRGELKS